MKEGTDNLIHELIYHRYLMNDEQMRQHFKELNTPQYIVLHIIDQTAAEKDTHSGRTYLKDISDKMQLPMRRISKIVGELRDKGLVRWAHDGNGNEGTYVVITENGTDLMQNQESMFRKYYGKVIERFGEEKMIELLEMMKRLEVIMSHELEARPDA